MRPTPVPTRLTGGALGSASRTRRRMHCVRAACSPDMPPVQNLSPSFGALAPPTATAVPVAPKRPDHPMNALFAGLSVEDEPTTQGTQGTQASWAPPAARIAQPHAVAPPPTTAVDLVGLYDSPPPPPPAAAMGAASSHVGGLFDMLGGPAPAPAGALNQAPGLSSGFDFLGTGPQVRSAVYTVVAPEMRKSLIFTAAVLFGKHRALLSPSCCFALIPDPGNRTHARSRTHTRANTVSRRVPPTTP
jgi:hypothetical protein